MEEINNKKRIIYFDVLNIIAIFAVIALHCNAIVHGNPSNRAWNTSLIVECLFYFAVPIFIMLSGATLMKYREKYDTKTFFKKRFLKVCIPFVIWAIIMFIWKEYILKMNIVKGGGILEYFNIFFGNKEESTYYFMFSILGIYLTMPLLSLLAKKENTKSLWFIVLLYFIFNGFVPNILKLFGINYNMDFTVQLGGYTIFILLGYLLSIEDISKKQRIIIYIGAIIGILYRFITTFILSKEAGSVVKTTWGYTSWHSILLASAVFLFVKNLNLESKLENNSKIAKMLTQIASCSFGVYLIHQIIMYYEKTIFNINASSWEWRTIGIITTYIISLLVVFLIKRIPGLKKIVP